MQIIKKLFYFLFILVLKVIALPLFVIVEAVLLLTTSCEAAIKIILGLFNVLMAIMFFYFIGTHDIEMLQQTGLLFIIEAVGLTLFMLTEGMIELVTEALQAVIFFNPFSRVGD